MDGIILYLPFGDGLVSDRLHFDQQVRVRQLMDRDGGACRTFLVEEFGVDLVVAGEVIHVHEEGSDFDDVAQVGAHAGQDVAEYSRCTARVCTRMSSCVVPSASTSAPAMELSARRELVPDTNRVVAGAFDMWKFAARLRFPWDDFAFHGINHST